LLAILACSSRQEMARQIQYLKFENQILRSKLPKRITVTAAERAQLVKAGRKCSSKKGALSDPGEPAPSLRKVPSNKATTTAADSGCSVVLPAKLAHSQLAFQRAGPWQLLRKRPP
jgi:putative transposase